jgi:hypothetical protein
MHPCDLMLLCLPVVRLTAPNLAGRRRIRKLAQTKTPPAGQTPAVGHPPVPWLQQWQPTSGRGEAAGPRTSQAAACDLTSRALLEKHRGHMVLQLCHRTAPPPRRLPGGETRLVAGRGKVAAGVLDVTLPTHLAALPQGALQRLRHLQEVLTTLRLPRHTGSSLQRLTRRCRLDLVRHQHCLTTRKDKHTRHAFIHRQMNVPAVCLSSLH